MKNKILLGVLLCSLCFTVQNANANSTTQNSLPAKKNNVSSDYIPMLENSSWYSIDYIFEPPAYAFICKNMGDTIIGEHKYSIIRKFTLDADKPELYNTTATLYMYEDIENQMVYQYIPHQQKDILLYDFSLQVGDTFPHYSNLILTDISYIENSGYKRKQLTFTDPQSDPTVWGDTAIWIEGIGNYTDMTYPVALSGADFAKIVCVHKDGDVVYDAGAVCDTYDCQYIQDIWYTCSDIKNPKSASSSASKILRDGQVFILRNGRTYTLTGMEVK